MDGSDPGVDLGHFDSIVYYLLNQDDSPLMLFDCSRLRQFGAFYRVLNDISLSNNFRTFRT